MEKIKTIKKTIKKTASKVSKPTKVVRKTSKPVGQAPALAKASAGKPVEPMVSKKAEIKVSKKVTKPSEVKPASLKVSLIGIDGASKGTMTLPSEVFGVKPNKTLIAQAIRVYLANQRQGGASTKTRSEVVGSTRKIYRQKGTGRARHGALKAPIFVGGGVAHGPKPHDFSLKLPKKMKKKALISALSEKAQAGFIKIVDGEFSGKTKEVALLMKKLELTKKGKTDKVLLIIDNNENVTRAARNVHGLEVERAASVSTYGVVVSKNVIFLKNAVEELSKRLTN